MGRRQFDVLCASLGLLLAAPVLAIAAVGIVLSSPGPVIYKTRRVGARGRPFLMYKLRTMHVRSDGGSRITGAGDPRIFPLGRLLRRTKIDELPQLVNVLKGEMSIVGPRPEDPGFVVRHYALPHRETLAVRPGLAGPGSIYSTTHGERILAGDDPEARYLEHLLPIKLALDVVYVRHASLRYDLTLMVRTLRVVALSLTGRREFPEPPEMEEARRLLVPARVGSIDEPSAPPLLARESA